jgi:hypothetical protein
MDLPMSVSDLTQRLSILSTRVRPVLSDAYVECFVRNSLRNWIYALPFSRVSKSSCLID